MRRSRRKPSPQDIQDHLDGLNHTEQIAVLTSNTARCQAIAIANYVNWFNSFEIEIHQDEKTKKWKLGPSPVEIELGEIR